MLPAAPLPAGPVPWIRFDRRELAGAFGDLGTSLPLLTGLIVVCGFKAGAVLVSFGLFQIFSGLRYGMPMSVQPLKAVATLAISTHLPASRIVGASLLLGAL